jgi:hypothetical protein
MFADKISNKLYNKSSKIIKTINQISYSFSIITLKKLYPDYLPSIKFIIFKYLH